MARASDAGRRVAHDARKEFEESGIPIEQLKRCDAESTDGTQLDHCVKVYLPAPVGPHGMVFRIARQPDGRLRLGLLTRPSVYATQPGTCDSRRSTRSRTDVCTSSLRTDASTA
jgi:hypothetical protein